MVTALDPAEERVKGIEAGADDFLSKPINQAEILARVKSLLRIRTLQRQVEEQAVQLVEQRVARLRRFLSPKVVDLILAGQLDDPDNRYHRIRGPAGLRHDRRGMQSRGAPLRRARAGV